ncbi:Rrf2 family transcriptional regulator [Mumia zhuanghuii]|uniref:Rrf2 family transcriptional regulator n=2 Tax=Mumia TaxID=1546255 RepID=A0ABW1QR67_9ACTN|nr:MULTISPECIES: Rrf2 family transcriptional regulator [Mumia]KAA1423719.1 Rrf2 family transcriptional regulator [Mumia zhuanghuii]
MSANSRLTIAVHMLSVLELRRRRDHEWSTSEQVAHSVRTNPVVVRRMLGDLRDAGLVESRRGPGAGWRMAHDATEISLADVDDALGAEPAYAMHRNEPNPACPVARGIRPALEPVYARVDDVVRAELARTTLADVFRTTMALAD